MPQAVGAGWLVQERDKVVSYRIDRDRRMVVVTYVGAIAMNDIRGIQALSRQDPTFDPSFTVLYDGLRADFNGLSPDDLKKIASNTPMRPGARRAFVVNSAVNYGISRMFAALSEAAGSGFPYALFDNLPDAIRWLTEAKQS